MSLFGPSFPKKPHVHPFKMFLLFNVCTHYGEIRQTPILTMSTLTQWRITGQQLLNPSFSMSFHPPAFAEKPLILQCSNRHKEQQDDSSCSIWPFRCPSMPGVSWAAAQPPWFSLSPPPCQTPPGGSRAAHRCGDLNDKKNRKQRWLLAFNWLIDCFKSS